MSPSRATSSGRHADADRVIGDAGALVGRDVGRDARDRAVDFGRGALVEGREAQQRRLAELQLVDVLRIDLGLDGQVVGFRHDQHDRLAGGDHAADGVDGRLEHGAVLRRADIDALELVLGGDLALDEFADLARRRRAIPCATSLDSSWSICMICNSSSEILPRGLGDRGDQLPALAVEPRRFALELRQPVQLDEVLAARARARRRARARSARSPWSWPSAGR